MPFLLALLISWLLTAAVLFGLARLLPGIVITNFPVALVAALVMGLVNVSLRPLLLFLTLPLNLLTLGLFAFIVNALMFMLVAWLVTGFSVNGFWAALLGSILLTIVTGLLNQLVLARA